VTLRPFLGSDLERLPAGAAYVPATNGWFVSDAYMAEIGVEIVR
jgi:hypothetical protein